MSTKPELLSEAATLGREFDQIDRAINALEEAAHEASLRFLSLRDLIEDLEED